MPTISMFYGIFIRLYFAPGEHPPADFHAYYAEFKGTVNIHTCEIMNGNLPRKQVRLAQAWAELHQEELLLDWKRVMSGQELFMIQPLA